MAREGDSHEKDDQRGSNVTPNSEEKTGAGSEATAGMDAEAKGASHTHRSAYGGEAGKPKHPSR